MSWRSKDKESLDKGSGGFGSLYKENRKNVIQTAQNYKCQKCLQVRTYFFYFFHVFRYKNLFIDVMC